MIYALLGGTGTLGQAVAAYLLRAGGSDTIRILSRGEHRQEEMRRRFSARADQLRFFVGDVRDEDRLRWVLTDVDRVILMAALKHVNSCEYNVLEATATNIDGAAATVKACIRNNIRQAVLISSDKAAEPITTYGATKLVAERIFVNANAYSPKGTSFHVLRYGNVLGSQGSLVEIWQQQQREGYITISDPDITRFWWTPEDAATFVIRSFDYAHPGDLLVPLMTACSLGDLADLIAPGIRQRPLPRYGIEKDHETMLAAHEAQSATYVDGLGALRSPGQPGEMPYGMPRYCSADYCSLEGVRRCLTAQ